MSSVRKSIGQLTLLKIGGAILGVIYSILQVRYFGVSREIELYFAASSVLYLITSLAQSGQLAELFLPVYHDKLRISGRQDADKCFSVVLNRLFFYSILISLISLLIAPSVVNFMIPGFSRLDQEIATNIFRVMALLVVLTMNSGFMQSYLNANKIYGRAEIAALMSSVTSIIILIVLFKTYGVWSLVISYAIGRIIELLVYIITISKYGYKHFFILKQEGFDDVAFFKSMYSTALYSGTTQLYNVVLTASISFLPEGIFAIFKYTQQLMQKTKGIIFQPLLTIFFTTFSKLSKDAVPRAQSIIKKYVSLVLTLNMIVLILIICFGDTILALLWGSNKFQPDKIQLAYSFLVLNFIASVLIQIGSLFRKVAMSYGYGKTIYFMWTGAQLITALVVYLLIKYFSVYGLLLAIPINALLLSSVSFGLIYWRKRKLTQVFEYRNLIKLTLIILILVPIGLYLNQLPWSLGSINGSQIEILLLLGTKVVIIIIGIILASILFKIKDADYLRDLHKKIRS